jgi:hypothetical protein
MTFMLSVSATARLLGLHRTYIRRRAIRGDFGQVEQHGRGASIRISLDELVQRFGHFTNADLHAAVCPPPKPRKPYERRARRCP